MSEGFVPCSACSRHVAARDAACPFCGAALSPAADGRVARSLRGSRAALLAAGAGTVLATAGCSQATTPIDRDAAPIDAIAPDAPPDDRDAADAAPAPDAAPADATTADAPTVQPAYGAPIFVDAAADSQR